MNRHLLTTALLSLLIGGCTKSDPTVTSQSKPIAPATPATPAAEVSAIPQDAVVLNFRVTGMHCDGCANALKGKLAMLTGVLKSDASFSNSTATVTAANPQIAETVLTTVTEMGYEAELVQQ